MKGLPVPDQGMKAEVAAMYDRAAPLFDQVGTRQFSHFARLLLDRLPLPANARVLDVATGRGALLFAAAEKMGAQGRGIGVDLAPGMVAETYAESRRRGLLNLDLLLMDGDEVAFRAGSFDLILCGYALHFLDYERVLPRLLRFLKPGGCFAAIIPYIPLSEQERARWGWLFELTKAVFPPGFVPPPAWIAPRRLNKPELAHDALRQAGFTNIQVERQEDTLYFRDEQDWWAWEWSQGSRFWLEGMSAEGLARFQREAFEHLERMKEPGGIAMQDGALFAIGYKPGG